MTKPKKKKPSRGRAKLGKLRRVSEPEIMRTSPPELADLPADFWTHATPVVRKPRRASPSAWRGVRGQAAAACSCTHDTRACTTVANALSTPIVTNSAANDT